MIKNNRILDTVIIALCFIFISTAVKAIDGEIITYSIDDCIEIAIKNDPNLKITTNKHQAAKSQVGQAKSDYFPALTGTSGYTFENSANSANNNNFSNLSSNGNSYYTVNLGVNQLVWNFGKTIAKINMKKYNYEATGYDVDYALLTTIYKVKIAYYKVLAAKANYDVFYRSVNINRLQYERASTLFEEGLKSKIDVVNSEVYLTDAEIKLISAENTYKTALIELNNAMYYTNAPTYGIKNTESFNFHKAQPVTNEINIAFKDKKDDIAQAAVLTSHIEKNNILQNFEFSPFEISMDDAIKKAEENRPDLHSLLLVEKAQEEALKALKLAYMPDIKLSAGYNFRHLNSANNNAFNAALGLNFPTVNIMDIKCKIEEGESYLDMAVNNIDLAKKNIYFEVQNNYVNMVQTQKRIPLLAQKVAQTLENFELADGRYTVGLGNFIELQDAQTNYNNAQLAYVQAVFDYNVSKVQLEKSMGVKWIKN
ncbi:MAG: TolC family protein [Candidatus Gastranaerophilales bacterium]|nr:TolC family protein [Candidatus Gastranaerophilales bacterium]